MKFHDWTTAVATIGPVTHIRVCHHYMCVIIPTQLTDYQKVVLDKGAIIIMQIKEVAIVVQSRELITEHIWSQVNIHSFGLPI